MICHRSRKSIAAAASIVIAVATGHVIAYAQDQKTDWMIQRSLGDTLSNCSLDSVSTTVLWFHQWSTAKSIALDSIALLLSRGKPHTITALLIGAAVGGAVGYFVTPGPSVESGYTTFAGHTFSGSWTIPGKSLVGFVIGGACIRGLIGWSADHKLSGPSTIDLRQLDRRAKANTILPLIDLP